MKRRTKRKSARKGSPKPAKSMDLLLRATGPLVILTLVDCAGSGVMTVDRDTYMVVKRTTQVGFGPPVAATAYVYDHASEFCERRGRTVETVTLDQVDSAIDRPSSASLTFRCVTK